MSLWARHLNILIFHIYKKNRFSLSRLYSNADKIDKQKNCAQNIKLCRMSFYANFSLYSNFIHFYRAQSYLFILRDNKKKLYVYMEEKHILHLNRKTFIICIQFHVAMHSMVDVVTCYDLHECWLQEKSSPLKESLCDRACFSAFKYRWVLERCEHFFLSSTIFFDYTPLL